ncbi:MAG: GDP-mannose 4,6-dehydratase [Thermoplasmata archaeon]|nr:GDP-mannose 4,6-dehydratase [Thermoplasmata archaeon]
MSRRALISGAAGFLGSHLVDRLLQDGWHVVGVDNLSSGRLLNLKGARERPEFRFLRADLRRPVRLPSADVIFHLASPASPPQYQMDPIGTLEVNGFGTSQLLANARRDSSRFVLASTSEVYGDPQVHPQPEEYWGHVNPIGLRSCYDEGKRFAEALATAWHRQRGVDVRIARIFNTYGPRMALDDGRVISTFLGQGWKGDPITVQGRGRQTRSFCYVDDLVDGLVRIAEVPPIDGPVNLGDPRGELSVLRLAQLVREMTGGRSQIVFVPRPPDDSEQRRPNIRRARRLLHWAPTTSLPQGLQRTANAVARELQERGLGRGRTNPSRKTPRRKGIR